MSLHAKCTMERPTGSDVISAHPTLIANPEDCAIMVQVC